ncbi:GntR family transcriptional regulator [Cohnella abietis]|uniref:GntR family transcriptional regulator n=1 Tax=Cohnella abietis TaxID=2507935 RepID=UPI00102EC294|nr:GntR family transcriptional regulator [Cohnella abietis]
MIQIIDRKSSVPMYEQIAQIIRDEIFQRKYGDFGCIGKHSEIAERFDVSIITVRAAIQKLADEGLVIIKQGKGTFVQKLVIKDKLNRLTGVSNIMLEANIASTVLVKSISEIDTPSHFEQSVKSALGERCYYINRVHLVENTVVGFARLYVPLEYGRHFSKNDIESSTIYRLYQDKLGISLGKGIQRIRASKADKFLASEMNLKQGTPLLYIQRESYCSNKKLIEFMELNFEYTQYEFIVELDLSAL